MSQIVLPVRWRIVLINVAWFAGLVFFFAVLHHLSPESKTTTLAAAVTGVMMSATLAILAWQLCRNRAVIDDDGILIQAGLYSQRWPLQVIHGLWSEHQLSEFHRSNGVHIYGYTAGYYTHAGTGRYFILAIGGSRVRCMQMEGYPPLCLDCESYSRLLSFTTGRPNE